MIQTIQLGIPVARIELVDEEHVKAFNAYSKIDLKVSADAVRGIPRHARPATAEQSELFGAIAEKWAAVPSTGRPRKRTGSASGRRAMTPSGRRKSLMPGKEAFATDVCVPISRLAECVQRDAGRSRRANGSTGRSSAMSATAISMSCLLRPQRSGDELERVKGFYERLIDAGHRHGGHLHRRAWHRHRQDASFSKWNMGGRGGRDARRSNRPSIPRTS